MVKKNTNDVKYPFPTVIKTCEILNIDTQMVMKKTNTGPRLVYTQPPL